MVKSVTTEQGFAVVGEQASGVEIQEPAEDRPIRADFTIFDVIHFNFFDRTPASHSTTASQG